MITNDTNNGLNMYNIQDYFKYPGRIEFERIVYVNQIQIQLNVLNANKSNARNEKVIFQIKCVTLLIGIIPV